MATFLDSSAMLTGIISVAMAPKQIAMMTTALLQAIQSTTCSTNLAAIPADEEGFTLSPITPELLPLHHNACVLLRTKAAARRMLYCKFLSGSRLDRSASLTLHSPVSMRGISCRDKVSGAESVTQLCHGVAIGSDEVKLTNQQNCTLAHAEQESSHD